MQFFLCTTQNMIHFLLLRANWKVNLCIAFKIFVNYLRYRCMWAKGGDLNFSWVFHVISFQIRQNLSFFRENTKFRTKIQFFKSLGCPTRFCLLIFKRSTKQKSSKPHALCLRAQEQVEWTKKIRPAGLCLPFIQIEREKVRATHWIARPVEDASPDLPTNGSLDLFFFRWSVCAILTTNSTSVYRLNLYQIT